MKKLCLVLGLITITNLYANKSALSDNRKEKKEEKIDLYKQIVDSAALDEGLFSVYKKEENYYYLIPDSLTNRDMLIVNKISQVPAPLNESGINKGMNFENLVIQFTINKAQKKVYAMQYKPFVEVDKDSNIAQSVADNYAKSILEYFDIVAYNADSTAVLINVNKVYDGSNTSFNNVFGMTGIGTSPIKELSYIKKIKSFPQNIVVKTFQTTKIPAAETKSKLTVEVTSNLVLLPKEPMTPRFEDSRVGYFTTPRWYFNDNQHSLEKRNLVTRWRLEPKDVEQYLRGELTEPVKPIVFYIDPATPEQWKKEVIAGIFDWNRAFEAAGFKNAIKAIEVSSDDKDFDIDDVRYSVITYAASDKSNAMGPSVFDPRSGEIIEADVIWWHNVMTSVHSWMRVQTGMIEPKSRANIFSDKHMGESIRFVSSHEVGHTLGLKHNMGASYAYPVDSLRSVSFCKQKATAPSIMDYARFNYVAQPEDGVKDITPKIGSYDKFAINWAYRYYPEQNAHREESKLKELIAKAYEDEENHYLAQQGMRDAIDPRAQAEDLGNDAIAASEYGLKNLKKTIPHILSWTTQAGDSYLEAGKLLNAVIGQWNMYAYHVLTNIGGVYMNNTVMGDGQQSYVYVPKSIQQRAVNYLINNVLSYPEWLFDNEVYNYVYPVKDSPKGYRGYSALSSYKNIQSYIFWDLLTNERLDRMVSNEAQNGEQAYKASALLSDLFKALFAKTKHRKSLSVVERATQKAFIDALIIAVDRSAVSKEKKTLNESKNFATELIFSGPKRISEAISLKRGILLEIEKLLKRRKNNGDRATRYHYEDLLLRIDQSLR